MFQITDLVNYERDSPFYPCIPLFFGIETCTGGHSYGPRIRDYILIHFVLSGKGTVTVDDQTYQLAPEQAFIIPARSRCWYSADREDPWEYCWAAFYAGEEILPMLLPDPSRPCIRQGVNVRYVKDIILKLIASHFSFPSNSYPEKEFDSAHLHLANNFDLSFSYEMSAALYQILSYMMIQNRDQTTERQRRLQGIKRYLDCCYNEPVRIREVAREFSIHPNYLTALFKEEFGVSPKQYVINRRICEACYLLETTDYPVKDISNMVGYEDQLAFSQIFKRAMGKPPSACRRRKTEKSRKKDGNMKNITDLCSAIALPEQVSRYVAQFDAGFDYETVREAFDMLTCREADAPEIWKAGIQALRERLKEDPRGLKMLSCMLRCCGKTRDFYVRNGISREIFVDTMKCFSRFVGEHMESFGEYGFDREWWTVRQLSGLLFRIGELEYEMVQGQGKKCIHLHIPSDSRLERERLEDSVGRARDFFREKFPAYGDVQICCHSWLLSPTLREVLSPGSRILAFQELFDIHVRGEDTAGEYKQWVFKRSDLPLTELPENTSLQRRLKGYLLGGGKMMDADGRLRSKTGYKFKSRADS